MDFGTKFGLSNAKFVYDYDTNYRIVNVQGRIGGQSLLPYNLGYDLKTGKLNQIATFEILNHKSSSNVTVLTDKVATFQRVSNGLYLVNKVSITIHNIEVFRMEFNYDNHRYVFLKIL